MGKNRNPWEVRGPLLRKSACLLAFSLLAAACAGTSDSAAETSEPLSCTTPSEGIVTRQYRELDQSLIDLGVEANDLSLDVQRSPTAQNCPAVLWVHGGSWQAGDKRTRATNVKAEHFISDGYVFVSINYRLAAVENDTRWPDFGSDVAAATAWVIDNADDLGVDPERISLIGHSSGAHLVSIVGTNPSLLEEHGRSLTDVACVISLDSVTHDLTDPPPWEVDIIDLAFPGQAALIDGSPTLQAEAHAAVGNPDFLIVTRGRDERISSSERLADTLNAGGAVATVADVSPYDHGEVNTMLGIEGEELVTPAVDGFLANCNA